MFGMDLGPTGERGSVSPSSAKHLWANAMTRTADQYRHSGNEALVSAEKANSKRERAELLQIAETWFKLAEEQRDREGRPRE
jgi:hypothetical protein